MWFLTSEVDKRVIYVLPNKDITIGRSVDAEVCNFAITDDPSISRKHSTLSIANDCLFLQDLGSRYGTFVNDSVDKLDPTCNIKLNPNESVKFGKMGSIWKVRKVNFVTCTSTLKGENLQSLKLCLGKFGGILKNEWDDSCSYLTMPAITLTIKVVLALAQSSHIVTVEFWHKCLEAITNNTALPNPENYTPKVIESTLNKENVSFHPNDQRKTLFAGKTVVFFSKRQLETYKTILEKCSAVPLLLSETKMTKSSLCDSNVIVIQYNPNNINQDTQEQKNQIQEIVSYVKGKGKRMVAEAEIGLAVLYCSTSKYCNPDFNFSMEIIKQVSGPTEKSSNVLVKESQEQMGQNKKENIVINESLNSTGIGEGSKRKLNEEDDEIMANASKKFAASKDITAPCNESLKRKLEGSNELQNPNKKFAADEEEDLFNFTSKSNNKTEVPEKKLNFSKPQKRNLDVTENDEDLFNFIQDKSKAEKEPNSIFDIKRKALNVKEEPGSEILKESKCDSETKIDISALRGSKLKELETLSNGGNAMGNINIKKEMTDDIDKKMQQLELGTTIITVRNDLIKREPGTFSSEFNESVLSAVKNFKKFKKVWPVKKQASTITKSSINVVIPETLNTEEMISQSY